MEDFRWTDDMISDADLKWVRNIFRKKGLTGRREKIAEFRKTNNRSRSDDRPLLFRAASRRRVDGSRSAFVLDAPNVRVSTDTAKGRT